MSQFKVHSNQIEINIKRAPRFVLGMYYFFAFLFFILPVLSVTLFVLFQGQFHFGFIFMFALFGVIGFFLLRSALWNTYGKEILLIKKESIEYVADYKWFKDKVREIDQIDDVNVLVKPHYNDGKHKLYITNENNEHVIETAVPLLDEDAQVLKTELEKLITK